MFFMAGFSTAKRSDSFSSSPPEMSPSIGEDDKHACLKYTHLETRGVLPSSKTGMRCRASPPPLHQTHTCQASNSVQSWEREINWSHSSTCAGKGV